MGRLYYVRHGQTVLNEKDLICGATDSPLTELGRAQAAETGKKILEMGICADEILHSPLSRARETAACIAACTGIPMREEPRLIEQDFGKWEKTPRNTDGFIEAKKSFAMRFGGGESNLKVAQRIYNLLDEITASDKTYILVAHNGILRAVHSYFHEMTNEEYIRYGIPNCDVQIYEF